MIIVKCFFGKELDFQGRLEQLGYKAVVPTTTIKDREVLLLKGYIFVEINKDNSEDLWNFIKEHRLKFVDIGDGVTPYDFSDKDMQHLLKKDNEGFKLGQTVLINDGLFKGYEGKIEGIQDDQLQISVQLNNKGSQVNIKIVSDSVRTLD